MARPWELTLITEGLSDVQITSLLTSRAPVACVGFRKKLSVAVNLRNLPFGIGAGFVGLITSSTGPTAASCAHAQDAHIPITRMQKLFRQFRQCPICDKCDPVPPLGGSGIHASQIRGKCGFIIS